jgi:hypothetical protein
MPRRFSCADEEFHAKALRRKEMIVVRLTGKPDFKIACLSFAP